MKIKSQRCLVVGQKKGPESSSPPPINQGGGYSSKHKKIKPVKGSYQYAFPQKKT